MAPRHSTEIRFAKGMTFSRPWCRLKRRALVVLRRTLYEVFLQDIYFGPSSQHQIFGIGLLVGLMEDRRRVAPT